MSYKLKNICFILTFIIVGCSQKSVNDITIYEFPNPSIGIDGTVTPLNWNLTTDTEDTNFLKNELELLQTIKLETNDSCLIGEISNMMLLGDTLIVIDGSRASKIYMFDINGRYLRSIGCKGEGPEDYGSINYSEIDSSGVLVTDWQKNRVIKYYYDNRKPDIQSFEESRPNAVSKLNDSLYAASYASYFTEHPFALVLINKNDSITGTARPFRNKRERPSGSFMHITNGELLYYRDDSDTIFAVSPNGLIAKYQIGIMNGDDVYNFDEKTKNLPLVEYYKELYGDDDAPFNGYMITPAGNEFIVEYQRGTKNYFGRVNPSKNISKSYIRADAKKKRLYTPFYFYPSNAGTVISYLDQTFMNSIPQNDRDNVFNVYPLIRDAVENFNSDELNPIICVFKLKDE